MPWRERGAEDDLVPPAPPSAGMGRRWLGLIWVVYLGDPVVTAWHAGGAEGLGGLLALLAFIGLYVWHYGASPLPTVTRSGVSPPAGPRLPGVLRYLGLLGLSVLAVVLVGQSATATWVFVAVSAMWTFGGWLPYVLALALAVVYEVLAYRVPGWERDNSLSFAIAFAVFAITSGMVALRRSRDLAEAQRENARLAVQEERNRVARDLHDILGHSLTVIRVKAELAARMVDLDPARARAEAEAVESLAREALADVRGAVEGFREISLAAEIARAREALESAGIAADLPRRVDTVDPALRELYAWTVREGVTNVIRHSGAQVCRVAIDDSGLRLADDGAVAGPGPSGRSQGHGLTGLAERARLAGATLSARRLEPRGFELVVSSTPGAGGAA